MTYYNIALEYLKKDEKRLEEKISALEKLFDLDRRSITTTPTHRILRKDRICKISYEISVYRGIVNLIRKIIIDCGLWDMIRLKAEKSMELPFNVYMDKETKLKTGGQI